MNPAPPIITSVTLSPSEIVAGTPMTAIVVWTGFPQTGITYAWRRSTGPVLGTAAVYTPTDDWEDLYCVVSIDNGRGTAMGASAYATVPEPVEGDLGDIWPDDSTVWPNDTTIWPA